MESIERARKLVDEAHSADPTLDANGNPAELVYADNMERWVARLVPDAEPLLLLASRCQHLERWSVPRDTFPMDRAGYNAWRRSLYRSQADRARELLLAAGVTESDADLVATWVSKTGLLRNPGTQALEDAACLVFLESEIDDFAARHGEYSREKFVTILQRIWRKMSQPARERALDLQVAPLIRSLLQEAVSELEAREAENGRGGPTPEGGS